MTPLAFQIVVTTVILAMGGLSHADAQSNSRTLVAMNQLAQYAIIKPVAENQVKAGIRDYIQTRLPRESPPVNLHGCGTLELDMGLRHNDLTDALARVAAHHYWWNQLLLSAGYPREIVTSLTDEIEGRLIKGVISKSNVNEKFVANALSLEANGLIKQLRLLKAKQHWRAKDVIYDECGGPGIFIEFKVPNGVRLFIASDFYVDLCRKQGLPPFDRLKCNHWVEVHNRAQEQLAGIY